MTKLLNGSHLAMKLLMELTEEIKVLKNKFNRVPHLVIILVGNDISSLIYVEKKIKDCYNIGLKYTLIHLSSNISEDYLIKKIKSLNKDPYVDGIIVQFPIPKQICPEKIILEINPQKDVDGFHPMNIGKLALEMPTFIPATPFGIFQIFKYYNINTIGKHTVIIGRSRLVGRPMSILMSIKSGGNSTVTLVHSNTYNINNHIRQADIVITALGIPGFLKSDMIKKDAIVIDVGIIRIKDSSTRNGYRIVGDVDFDNVYKKTSYITPVPGGVGPMTRAMLLKNTVLAANNNFAYLKNNI